MTRKLLLTCLCAGLALSPLACRRGKAKGLGHEKLVALLQEEATYLKKGGEDIHPSLGKMTWTIEKVDVTEHPADEVFPWRGSIHFKIRHESRDYDGNVTTDTSQKRFDYKFASAIGKWIIDVPPAKTR